MTKDKVFKCNFQRSMIDENLNKATIRPNLDSSEPKISPPSGGSNVSSPSTSVYYDVGHLGKLIGQYIEEYGLEEFEKFWSCYKRHHFNK